MIIKILFLVGLGVIPFMLKSEHYFYWLILIISLILCWVLKITSVKSLRFTLLLFLTASFLNLLGLYNIAEVAFKLSLTALIIGVSQAVFELSI